MTDTQQSDWIDTELHNLLVSYQDEMFTIRNRFLGGGDRGNYFSATSQTTVDYKRQAKALIEQHVQEARKQGYDAGYRQGQVDFEAQIGAEGSDLVRLNRNATSDVANPPKAAQLSNTKHTNKEGE